MSKKKHKRHDDKSQTKSKIVLTPKEREYIDNLPDDFRTDLSDLTDALEKLENMGISLENYANHHIVSEENKKGSLCLNLFKGYVDLYEESFNNFTNVYSEIIQGLPEAVKGIINDLAQIMSKGFQLIKSIEERDRE